MWTGEHRVVAQVDPEAVWRRWVDTTYWTEDDPDTKAAGYDHAGTPPDAWAAPEHRPLRAASSEPAPSPSAGLEHAATDRTPQPGTTGWVKPAKGPLSHFTVIRADRTDWRFDLHTRFPGATMHFEHQMRPTGAPDGALAGAEVSADGATYELVHRVRFSGPAAAVWGALVGRSIAAGLPRVLANIVEHAGGVVRI
ncbi:MAG: hypothetical protein IPK37_05525 [Austwickia sp.]|jgi:hypothetical protein|nr:MAG: hypothetical protein IPK37_05525 [Austwickia sp.]